VDHPEKLPEAPIKAVVEAGKSGYIEAVHARTVGETAVLLGAGRQKKGDPIDQAVGISVMVKVGQKVEAGEPLFVIHVRHAEDLADAEKSLRSAVSISSRPVEPLPLFYGLID
jgi:pyrimidine-nucleoside phosphorylase